MQLESEFFKLPLRFDVARMTAEIAQFSASDWRAHPQGYAGNTAVSLISAGGDPNNDTTRGPMLATPHLGRCPYLQQVLASFGTVLGRTRLMKIEGEGEATAHVDTNYYWLQRVRIHVPIVTYPEVIYVCNDKQINMGAGECWIFNTWRLHNSLNPNSRARIHLVADSVGSDHFWNLVDGAEVPFGPQRRPPAPQRIIPFNPNVTPELSTEHVNFPVVMSPYEQETLFEFILTELRAAPSASLPEAAAIEQLLRAFLQEWRGLWARFGENRSGEPTYRAALNRLDAALTPLENKVSLANGVECVEVVRQALVRPALNLDLPGREAASSAPPAKREPVATAPVANVKRAVSPSRGVRFDRPIFIVACPRSGSSMLFETFSDAPNLFTIGGESHEVIERVPGLNPQQRGFDSNRLTGEDATPSATAGLLNGITDLLRDRDGRTPAQGSTVRMLEKTPKNALRIPFLNAVFPDALFVYLYREARDNISSIIDAWKSERFVTYPNLPDWEGPPWSLLLIPEWRALRRKSLAEIAAAQWVAANQAIVDDLGKLPAERWCTINYDEFLASPQDQILRLCKFAGLSWDRNLGQNLPPSRHTLTPPDPKKWERNAPALGTVLPSVEPIAARTRKLVEVHAPPALGPGDTALISNPAPSTREVQQRQESGMNPPAAPAAPNQGTNPQQPPQQLDLKSVHTTNLPALFDQLGISLLVSTYQAGKLIACRVQDGALNTHFSNFNSPMGLAGDNARLAVGTLNQVWEFRNQPDVGKKLQPPNKVDACFLPRRSHFTGDIRIHEIAYAKDELWIVNTRFSCLCTLDSQHSFVPRWRPPFVTGYSPEDRCHLNGLAVVDGVPRYITALGETDDAEGWRQNKKNGGIMMDVSTNEIIARGLSMPHSPRWYANRLWVLESGNGRVCVVDPKTGKVEPIVELPGFTRGIDFCGKVAFVGLSQVRETAVFSGIPITEKPTSERNCGVWAIDITSGQILGFIRFEGSVQEIFAVQVLNGIRFPDVINDDETILGNSFVLPDEALKDVRFKQTTAAK